MQGQIPKLSESGIEIKTVTSGSVQIGWQDVRGLHKSLFSQELSLKCRGFRNVSLGLPRKELEDFLPRFFAAWKKYDQGAAAKGLFDYTEPRRKIHFGLLAFSLVFGVFMSIPMFLGGLTHTHCTNDLRLNSTLITPEILKQKKRMRGNYKLTLQFTAENGQTIMGKTETVKMYDRGDVPTAFSVIYSKDDPKCWVLSETAGQKDVNWAQRRLKTASTFSMAALLLFSGLLLSTVSILRITERRPYLEQLEGLDKQA